MYTIITDTYLPYKYNDLDACLRHIEDVSMHIKKSIKLIEKNNGRIIIRCPLSGDYLAIVASIEELNMLHREMIRKNLYRL